VSEFPVEVNGRPTHIDIVLRHRDCLFYLVLECKRADPARSNWCFVKAPYVSRSITSGERLVREVVEPNPHKTDESRISLQWINREQDVYRLAFELKSDGKGDGRPNRDQVNDAVSQVLRGMNGLIALAAEEPHFGGRTFLRTDATGRRYAAFMPAVLTTANLWVSNTDVAQAQLQDGTLTRDQINLEKRDWVYFQYPQSPDLKHNRMVVGKKDDMSELLYREYTRTICIVNADGMPNFFSYWRHCDDWKFE
jgi:hypothetical protein